MFRLLRCFFLPSCCMFGGFGMFLVSRVVHVVVAGQFWSLDDARPSFRLPLSRCRRPLQPKGSLPGNIFKLTHHAMGGVAAHSTCSRRCSRLRLAGVSLRGLVGRSSGTCHRLSYTSVETGWTPLHPFPSTFWCVLVVHFAFAGVEEPDGWVRSVGSFRALSDSSGRGG